MYEASETVISSAPRRRLAAGGRVRLLVVFEQRLHREAFAALALQDGRFDVVVAASGPRSWKAPAPTRDEQGVALVGAECHEKRLRTLLGGQRLAGGVLVVGPGHGPDPADEGRDAPRVYRLDRLSLSLASSDAAWTTIADGLLRPPTSGDASRAFPPESSRDGRTVATELEKHASLTPREKEILAALGAGLSPREAGEQLHIAVSTVENHKARLMKKLDIHKSMELVRFAIRVGVAPL